MPSKSSKRKKAVLLSILGLIGALALAITQPWSNQPSQVAIAPHQTHWDLSPTLQTYRIPLERGNFVNIAPLNDTTFFVCNYDDIFLLVEKHIDADSKQYSLKKLNKPDAVDFWNPTGLFFKADTQSLYVANYKGHNVLQLAYNREQQSFDLTKNITDPDMVSPENLIVRDSGEVIAADYDGSAVFKFAPNGQRLWRQTVGQAHGIASIKETIYATSTLDRTIVKLSNDGDILQTAGGLGADIGEYIWPITITALANGQLAVTDTHTGRLNLINQQLEVVKAIGANGPGVDLLNYPYALTQLTTGELLLADTYKGRILRLTEDWTVTEQLISQFEIAGTGLLPVISDEQEPYRYPDFPGVEILSVLGINSQYDEAAVGGFNSIDYDNSAAKGSSRRQTNRKAGPNNDKPGFSKQLELHFAGSSSYAISDYYWYSTWAKLVSVPNWGDLIVVSSPQSPFALVIDTLTGGWSRAELTFANFPEGDTIRSPQGKPVDLLALTAPAMEKFKTLKNLLDTGSDRAEAFQQAFATDLSEFLLNNNEGNTPQNVWSALLTATEPAKSFYSRYQAAPSEVKTFAAEYFASTSPQPYNYIFELLAVNYLAGGSRFNLSHLDSQVSLQTPLTFYPDHTLETALTADYRGNLYAAANQNQSIHTFSLSLPEATNQITLRFDWLNAENHPTHYTVSFVDDQKTVVSTQQVVNNHDLVNIISATAQQPIKRIDVEIERFEGDQRLLLDNLDVFSVQ